MDRNTQTLFCPTSNLVMYDGKNDDQLQKTSGDVILEQDQAGNNFLHLILPADRINFLQGGSSGAKSFFSGQNADEANLFNFDEDDGFDDPD